MGVPSVPVPLFGGMPWFAPSTIVVAAGGVIGAGGAIRWQFLAPSSFALLDAKPSWQGWAGASIPAGSPTNPSSYLHRW
ncbi:MAG: hypothetical protein AB7I19_10870 [Planctomycetota bacterium]